jgi:hypothetical protein
MGRAELGTWVQSYLEQGLYLRGTGTVFTPDNVAIGPDPHRSFIEVSNPAAVGNGCWQVAGAGADGEAVKD